MPKRPAKKKPFSLKNPKHWSAEMDSVYESEVHDRVRKKTPNSSSAKWNPFGFRFNDVRFEIVENGRADFTEGYTGIDADGKQRTITKHEKVLLYCFTNLRGHFFSSFANFKFNRPKLTSGFKGNPPVFLDIGCGPGTSALAFAEVFKGQEFTYVGVDCAWAMRRKAKALIQAGVDANLVSSQVDVHLEKDWSDIGDYVDNGSCVIVNFSFFFGSYFLTTKDVSSFADVVIGIADGSRVFISHTNSQARSRNRKYLRFLRRLGYDNASEALWNDLVHRSVRYYQRRISSRIGKEDFLHQVFELE